MSASYYVYVLTNPDGKAYIGLSEKVALRLDQHNNGGSKWTAKYRPWALTWTSGAMSLGDARRLENTLKRQKGGAGLANLMRHYGS
jgi:predicted GIY-YIG superfamily endonuclease